MEDLRLYAEDVLTRKSRNIEPLPEIKPYEVYTYAQEREVRNPFEPFFKDVPEQEKQMVATGGLQPNLDRNREELESFPLDTLRMVGTLERQEETWAIVLNRQGSIHRVQVGNYMGRNHGKITNVLEDRIELTEIIPDGLGGWQERQASLALVE